MVTNTRKRIKSNDEYYIEIFFAPFERFSIAATVFEATGGIKQQTGTKCSFKAGMILSVGKRKSPGDVTTHQRELLLSV